MMVWGKPVKREEIERVLDLRAEGLSVRAIARELGRSDDFVQQNLRREAERARARRRCEVCGRRGTEEHPTIQIDDRDLCIVDAARWRLRKSGRGRRDPAGQPGGNSRCDRG